MKLLPLLLALVASQQVNLGWVSLVDVDGADDKVAQSDVNYMASNKDNVEFAEVAWSWDDTSYPGTNSGDGCSLWDLNQNGNADFALCVRINTNGTTGEVTHTLTQLFDCRDTKDTTCPSQFQPGYTDMSNVSQMYPTAQGTGTKLKSTCRIDFMRDPFANVTSHQTGQQNSTHDTRALCRLYYSDLKQGAYPDGVIQPGDPQLLNVCSYSSSSPTSNSVDCVVLPGSGFLVVNKWSNQAQACTTYQGKGFECGGEDSLAVCTLFNCTETPKVLWNFTYTSAVETKNASVLGWGWSPLVSLLSSTYVVSEGTLPAGWVQIGFRCTDNQTNAKAVVIRSGQTLVCYFVNFFGNISTFEQIYGNISNGGFGNITLDEYVPPRTFAPTPVTPTPACPASLGPFFTACNDSDFAVGATCSTPCLSAANTAQIDLSKMDVPTQDICLGMYNTNLGPFLSSFSMNVISNRVTAVVQEPLCKVPVVASGACSITSSGLLALMFCLISQL